MGTGLTDDLGIDRGTYWIGKRVQDAFNRNLIQTWVDQRSHSSRINPYCRLTPIVHFYRTNESLWF